MYEKFKERSSKKIVYTIYSDKKNFDKNVEKNPFLVYDDEKNQHVTIKKTDGVRYFVSVEHYLNRDQYFLKHLPNATYIKRDVNDFLAVDSQALNVYEVLNHNTTARVYSTKHDFILPVKRSPGNLDKFEFDNDYYF